MEERPFEIRKIDTSREDVQGALNALREKLSPRGDIVSEAGRRKTLEVFGQPLSPQQVVEKICHDVRVEGADAVLRYTRSLDSADLTLDELRVSPEELKKAHVSADDSFIDSVKRIRDNVLQFQTAILHRDVEIERSVGVTLRQRYVALHRIGICVPGGAAAYPSTVLMTAVPAQAAGVQEIAVVAPPTDFGANNGDVLATCHELGITEVYRIGGAQAVAALAYGIEGIPKVDKIVGPGNMFVALAKKHVYGDVDIDSIAGPSEVVVIADETTRPDFTASDMLAQAEHSPGSAVLITWDRKLLEATEAELHKQVRELSRCELTVQSLQDFGCMILVQDADEACDLTNLLAPEHLHIATSDSERLLAKIRNAGATFLGNYAPVAMGDYVAGPSHVLPTGATATWASGLSSNDFLRAGSVIHYTAEAMKIDAIDVQILADKEGLTAHRKSVDIRL